jgi:hypothetical protein
VTLAALGEAFDGLWRFLELPGSLDLPETGFENGGMREASGRGE